MNIIVLLCLTAFCLGCVYGQENKTANVTEMLNPSEHQELVCNGTFICDGGPCYYKRNVTANHPSQPVYTTSEDGASQAYTCGDREVKLKGILHEDKHIPINETVICYNYTSSNGSFVAAEVLIDCPEKVTVDCKLGTEICATFNRTNSSVILVSGIPTNCFAPPVATDPPAPSPVSTPNSTSPGEATTPQPANATDAQTPGQSAGGTPTQGGDKDSSSRMEPAIFGIMVAFLAIRYQLSA